MAMIDIEYRHPAEDPDDPTIRRRTNAEMERYIRDLVFEMQMADVSCSYKGVVTDDGSRALLINGRTVDEILDGVKVKMLEAEDSCDHGAVKLVGFGRPTLDWNRRWPEDIPDTLMKNAVAKVFADENRNRIDVIERRRPSGCRV